MAAALVGRTMIAGIDEDAFAYGFKVGFAIGSVVLAARYIETGFDVPEQIVIASVGVRMGLF